MSGLPAGHFLLSVVQIVLIDLVLAGDNALVIAMVVRSLPRRERRIGSACGAAAAVALRVALTFVASRVLTIEYLKLAGGLFILWIAVKVLVDASDPPDSAPAVKAFWQAIYYIAVADLTMSVDNILAIAGVSNGHLMLIVFGLCLSIPFVVFSANLLAELMDRYPVTIYLGAGILGRVGGDMILTDPVIARRLHPSDAARYIVEGALIVGIIVVGRAIGLRRRRRQ
jgi:YjbE family integral membrane protein